MIARIVNHDTVYAKVNHKHIYIKQNTIITIILTTTYYVLDYRCDIKYINSIKCMYDFMC